MSSGSYHARRQYWVTLQGGRSSNLAPIVMVSEEQGPDGASTGGLSLLPAGGGPAIRLDGEDCATVRAALSQAGRALMSTNFFWTDEGLAIARTLADDEQARRPLGDERHSGKRWAAGR